MKWLSTFIAWHESSMVLTKYISDPNSCGTISSESSSIFFFKSIMVDFAFLSYLTSLIFSLYIFLDSEKSHWSFVILLVPRNSALYSDYSSQIHNSRITCIQQQGFLNKSSKSRSRHQHCNNIGLDQQYSCWNPKSSRIHPSDIISNSWMVVWMEVYQAY